MVDNRGTMTPEEINEAVKRKLQPVRPCNAKHGPRYQCEECIPKDYCRDIGAAWGIVQKHAFVVARTENGWMAGPWSRRFWGNLYIDADGEFTEADTAPMAICLAFLKPLG